MKILLDYKFIASSLITLISYFSITCLTLTPCFEKVGELIFATLFGVTFYFVLKSHSDKLKAQDNLNKEIQREKEKVLKSYNSYINQLSNIVAGLNHEVSPWLGGIQNKVIRLQERFNKNNQTKKYSSGQLLTPESFNKKLNDIQVAADTAINILKVRSKDIKKLQRYSTTKSNLFDTIETWVGIAMVDRVVKCDLTLENIYLQFESLNFEVNHSPLLLSQIILNLVKNSVEHNTHMLENLLIKISGDSNRKCIIYEDNGKGIPDDRIDDLFEPGITSKKFEKEIHGLGLSLCVDYCECMGGAITVEKSAVGARFIIYFDYDYENNPAKIKHVKKGGMID
jgi:signal transduction histidine kinase